MASSRPPSCPAWLPPSFRLHWAGSLLAPWLGLFQDAVTSAASQLWRPSFVMIFAGSLAAILRGILLNVPVIPTFAIVLGATAAVGLTLWRTVCLLLDRRDVRQRELARPIQPLDIRVVREVKPERADATHGIVHGGWYGHETDGRGRSSGCHPGVLRFTHYKPVSDQRNISCPGTNPASRPTLSGP